MFLHASFDDLLRTQGPQERSGQILKQMFSQPPPLPALERYQTEGSSPFRLTQCSKKERSLAATLSFLGISVFIIAAVLDPYESSGLARTHGTHTQLGLPPCTMKLMTGLSCPGCGMTTSFSLLMHNDLYQALQTNWAAVFIALLTLSMTALLSITAATGYRLARLSLDDAFRLAAMSAVCVAGGRYFLNLAVALLSIF
jgi:hypothetical protein